MTTRSAKIISVLKYIAVLLMPPLIVLCAMLAVFRQAEMYPFGERSLSWCDMSQQVVPLMNQFKDILDGKSSLFLNFSDAGGMNFYGVFFFFLASPFTFLVKFVEKQDMMMFMNVMVMLKMMTCALTAALCISRIHKRLDPLSVIFLSVMYPFCGYAMMYYQNIIWLDMMYLFPLLVLSLVRLARGGKPLMYTLVLSASVIVNYYIGYMVVVFILLFVGVYAVQHFVCKEKYGLGSDSDSDSDTESENCGLGTFCRGIFGSSFVAALITAAVWLPSLIQYFHSARGFTTMRESLESASAAANYTTIMPMLMCLAFPVAALIFDILSQRKRSRANDLWLILAALMFAAMLAEPINKMWHTGNYMSFPCRYGYMVSFLMLLCCGYPLSEKPQEGAGKLSGAPRAVYLVFASVMSALAVCGNFRYAKITRLSNEEKISRYAYTLWGNEDSFKLILGIFLVTLLTYLLLHALFRCSMGSIHKRAFICFCGLVFAAEVYTNTGIYITYSAERNEEGNAAQSLAYDLGGRTDSGSFARVKSYSKVYNNNMIGAMGYPSIAHYTSLNDQDYMTMMKQLGYSGVWMESGSVGGTRLSDAALSIGYEINGGCSGSEEIYCSDAGFIHKFPQCLPMGVLLEEDSLEKFSELDGDRISSQEQLSEALFGRQIIERYIPQDIDGVQTSGSKTTVIQGHNLIYELDIEGSREIYFDCYDGFSNRLREPTYDSFEIAVNGETRCESYPDSSVNGFYPLGEYTDCTVTVEIRCKRTNSFSSFGLFGLDTQALDECCKAAEGAGLSQQGGRLVGSVKNDGPKCCFISVPYNDGLKVKVNGRSAEISRVFSDFVSVELPEGECEIELYLIPQGFAAGCAVSVMGIALLVLWCIFGKKLSLPDGTDTAACAAMLAVSALVFFAVYIMPFIVNIAALEEPPTM